MGLDSQRKGGGGEVVCKVFECMKTLNLSNKTLIFSKLFVGKSDRGL